MDCLPGGQAAGDGHAVAGRPANGYGSEPDSPNHQTLLGAGMVLLEYLNGLDQLDEPEVFLMALPLRIPGADGAPARVVAMLGSA